MADEIIEGPGFAVGSLDAMGEGFGFRKVRKELGVTAFGVNAVVMPPRYRSPTHTHEEQEEVYLCLQGSIDLDFGEAGTHTLGPGDMARVDADTPRSVVNSSDEPATWICFGGKDGYVGRDGQMVDGTPDAGFLDS
jgi:quercetin dioxygenase-like cupin family protein